MTTIYDDAGWWRRDTAASYMKLSPRTLANWAVKGKGPKCYRFSGGARGGSVRYRKEEIDAFIQSSGLAVRTR